ncbi:hypothetical protein [Oharaeibacter diazotrophicus]|uniref:Uncharacterized protein n=1 Tax=Oharaeibacter diazotrophicus TaxID=1920512 RepID=A0A4R6RG24_9HYPH|nr:hypothetical protein [Oharaeibacter diazotrophicus]TDP85309.1 hypothetical protein EDD54_2161 [Oharaeibacter diazotrophicus]BBE74280.1 hypothetical protein OHA_1_03910 [Pleomorphomonas sp. SM30]GLS76030.1 hypothetical protein GCM10007904_13650 [Oharaeibacter diazotrophicus]
MWNFFDGDRPPTTDRGGAATAERRATGAAEAAPEADAADWTAWLPVTFQIAARRSGERRGDGE